MVAGGLKAVASAAVPAPAAAPAEAAASAAAAPAGAAAAPSAAVAAATATAAGVAAATAAAAAAAAVLTGPGFVDGEGAAVVLLAVEGGDGRICLGVVGHFDEPEALAAAGVSVVDDLGGHDLPVLGKQLL